MFILPNCSVTLMPLDRVGRAVSGAGYEWSSACADVCAWFWLTAGQTRYTSDGSCSRRSAEIIQALMRTNRVCRTTRRDGVHFLYSLCGFPAGHRRRDPHAPPVPPPPIFPLSPQLAALPDEPSTRNLAGGTPSAARLNFGCCGCCGAHGERVLLAHVPLQVTLVVVAAGAAGYRAEVGAHARRDVHLLMLVEVVRARKVFPATRVGAGQRHRPHPRRCTAGWRCCGWGRKIVGGLAWACKGC